eukprot:3554020-Pyramimonas_sp.AAC.1
MPCSFATWPPHRRLNSKLQGGRAAAGPNETRAASRSIDKRWPARAPKCNRAKPRERCGAQIKAMIPARRKRVHARA